MRCKMKPFAITIFFAFILLSPVLMTGTVKKADPGTFRKSSSPHSALASMSATKVYDSLRLEELGLNQKAFAYAWKGFRSLLQKGKLLNTDYITIADFSQSSRNKRLYIIDLIEMRVFKNTYVAHGRKSGGEFARSFSNRPESNKSSLGFYVTGKTYFGIHGLSLLINGLEKGINDKALVRRIVVHGSEYVGDQFLEGNPFSGRSYGCPAVPSCDRDTIINTIKEGTCLFIYHPSKSYLTRSKILNG